MFAFTGLLAAFGHLGILAFALALTFFARLLAVFGFALALLTGSLTFFAFASFLTVLSSLGILRLSLALALLLALPVLVIKLALGGVALALIETLSAKMRIFRVPEFLGTAFLVAVIGLLVNVLLGAG